MSWNPTNANDVTLIVSRVIRDDSGARTGTTEIANHIVLSGAWAGTRNVSGSSGDPVEYEAEGMATDKRTETT